MTFAGKINKIPEFYMIIARKIFFPVFKGGGVARAHPAPCPRLLRIWITTQEQQQQEQRW